MPLSDADFSRHLGGFRCLHEFELVMQVDTQTPSTTALQNPYIRFHATPQGNSAVVLLRGAYVRTHASPSLEFPTYSNATYLRFRNTLRFQGFQDLMALLCAEYLCQKNHLKRHWTRIISHHQNYSNLHDHDSVTESTCHTATFFQSVLLDT